MPTGHIIHIIFAKARVLRSLAEIDRFLNEIEGFERLIVLTKDDRVNAMFSSPFQARNAIELFRCADSSLSVQTSSNETWRQIATSAGPPARTLTFRCNAGVLAVRDVEAIVRRRVRLSRGDERDLLGVRRLRYGDEERFFVDFSSTATSVRALEALRRTTSLGVEFSREELESHAPAVADGPEPYNAHSAFSVSSASSGSAGDSAVAGLGPGGVGAVDSGRNLDSPVEPVSDVAGPPRDRKRPRPQDSPTGSPNGESRTGSRSPDRRRPRPMSFVGASGTPTFDGGVIAAGHPTGHILYPKLEPLLPEGIAEHPTRQLRQQPSTHPRPSSMAGPPATGRAVPALGFTGGRPTSNTGGSVRPSGGLEWPLAAIDPTTIGYAHQGSTGEAARLLFAGSNPASRDASPRPPPVSAAQVESQLAQLSVSPGSAGAWAALSSAKSPPRQTGGVAVRPSFLASPAPEDPSVAPLLSLLPKATFTHRAYFEAPTERWSLVGFVRWYLEQAGWACLDRSTVENHWKTGLAAATAGKDTGEAFTVAKSLLESFEADRSAVPLERFWTHVDLQQQQDRSKRAALIARAEKEAELERSLLEAIRHVNRQDSIIRGVTTQWVSRLASTGALPGQTNMELLEMDGRAPSDTSRT